MKPKGRRLSCDFDVTGVYMCGYIRSVDNHDGALHCRDAQPTQRPTQARMRVLLEGSAARAQCIPRAHERQRSGTGAEQIAPLYVYWVQ